MDINGSHGAVADRSEAFRIEDGESCRWRRRTEFTTKRRNNPVTLG
jgi:hypothetical protein